MNAQDIQEKQINASETNEHYTNEHTVELSNSSIPKIQSQTQSQPQTVSTNHHYLQTQNIEKKHDINLQPSVDSSKQQRAPQPTVNHNRENSSVIDNKSADIHLIGQQTTAEDSQRYFNYEKPEVEKPSSSHRYQYCRHNNITIDQILKNEKDLKHLPNVRFYCNKEKATYDKIDLKHIHDKLSNNYEWMESCHDYIQWLFPNHYRSRFNYSSYELTEKQAQLFRASEELGNRMLTSFKMFMMFMGVQAHLEDVVFEIFDKQRMKQTLIENTHNHLRIRRILACLSVTGFRLLALWLLNMLDYLIDTQPELKNYKWRKSLRSIYNEQWLIYGQNDHQQKAMNNCFVKSIDVFYEVNPVLKNLAINQPKFRKRIPRPKKQ